jgi:dihydroorotate dehydrogenase (fumarate)/dihydroorotate dehydrogenase
MLRRMFVFDDPSLRNTLGGIEFPNPVGLAGGFDKNGVSVKALACAGFGAVEVGSVSAYPSEGNPQRPRLFRVPQDEAIVVYYGVPNDGAEVVAERLASVQLPVPLGINLVETNTGVPADHEHVIEELVKAAQPFLPIADYINLNLNCPNTTAGKSPFEDPENLRQLLEGYAQYDAMPAVFVKVIPTEDPAKIDRILTAIDGFSFVKGIAFSLPSGKPYAGLKTPVSDLDRMPGTLCGKPVRQLANDAIHAWYSRIDTSRHVLIGIGGIFSAEDVYEKIRLGASLVQLYTALIYNGPGLLKRINRDLCHLLARDGFGHISEAIGTE